MEGEVKGLIEGHLSSRKSKIILKRWKCIPLWKCSDQVLVRIGILGKRTRVSRKTQASVSCTFERI